MNSITNTEIGKRFELIFQDLQSYTLPIMLPHRKLRETSNTFLIYKMLSLLVKG